MAMHPFLKALHKIPPELEELGTYVAERLVEAPPILLKEGGIIKDGVDSRLDELRQQLEDDKQWLTNLEVTERERIGVANILRLATTKPLATTLVCLVLNQILLLITISASRH